MKKLFHNDHALQKIHDELRNVTSETIWGWGINNYYIKEPHRSHLFNAILFKRMVRDINSQSKDNFEIMQSIIGKKLLDLITKYFSPQI